MDSLDVLVASVAVLELDGVLEKMLQLMVEILKKDDVVEGTTVMLLGLDGVAVVLTLLQIGVVVNGGTVISLVISIVVVRVSM